MSDAPLEYSVGEVAQLLGVSPSTVRYWADQSQLECYRTPGGQRRFSREHVDRLLEQAQRAAQQKERELRDQKSV